MKGIFGFLTGAAIGAGSLLGLRKAFKALDQEPGPQEPASNLNLSGAFASPVKPASVKSGESSSYSGNGTAIKQPDQEVSPDSSPIESDPVSLVGEPIARHKEPAAATQTAPAEATSRAEIAETALPQNLEVEPAAKTTPVQAKTGGSAQSNGSKRTPKAAPTPRPDDLMIILDIGPVFNRKLQAAGINSFKALAQLTPAQIEAKTGIPAERVERGRWIEQAQKLSTQAPKE